MTRTCTWEEVAKEHQQRRDALIPEKWRLPSDVLLNLPSDVTGIPLRFLTDREIELTECTASQLARRIAERETSSVEVTLAFCHRAAIAQQLVNCLTEICFDDAIQQARELDRILEETGKQVGPLHGVPFSIKDHYNIKGLQTTAGYISYSKFPPKEKDALIVEILRKAGAVFYVKTNNPQCMMVLETVSNIYGRTLNPKNIRLGAGGSSGGEGALISLHGSPVGLGSDIGGSIRVPAAFNGLYGFKPSGKRVPTSGWECTMMGNDPIPAVAGPLGHSVEDLDLFFKIVSDAKPWFSEPVLEIPWKTDQELKFEADYLKIGLMVWDEVVMPHPYITRVIREVGAKLKAAGHDVVEFEPYDHGRAWSDILLPLYFTDGGLDIRNTLAASGEPMLPSAKRLLDDPTNKLRDIHDIWRLHMARDIYRTEYLAHWNATSKLTRDEKPIDVILCPAGCVQGTPHDVKPQMATSQSTSWMKRTSSYVRIFSPFLPM
ncbi:amidase signature domain-containing protein [Aspergillus ambiguus]|uniref:amidase signature domain-containing protein n=1 Tax=Aspergillus ambiguus TaxID=176160 RepID=UPI003CCCD202